MAAAQTASRAGVYVPPDATGSAAVSGGSSPTGTTITFATSTAQPRNSYTFLHYFIIPYLEAHVLSVPSWRYAYIFWIAIGFVTVAWSLGHQFGRSYGANSLAALLRRLTVRRVTWGSRATSPQPCRKPQWRTVTVGQLVVILALTALVLTTTLIGADYIAPTTCTFGGQCEVQIFKSGPPKSTFTRLAKRDDIQHNLNGNWKKREPAPPSPGPGPKVRFVRKNKSDSDEPLRVEKQKRNALQPRASALELNPNGYAPFNDPLLAAPNYLIERAMWTISSRLGLIAYAMLPLCVSLSLKMWPFALYATPWLTGYGYDKTVILHRWMGRLVWILSTAHTVTFAIQLSWDYDPFGRRIVLVVWQYYRFNWGVIAYIALTLMVILSFNPFRQKYFEAFYYSHCALVVVFLVGCIIHYEPLWAWATIAIGMWGAERFSRVIVWLFLNGFVSRSIGPLHFWGERIGIDAMAQAPKFRSEVGPKEEISDDQVESLSNGRLSPAPFLVPQAKPTMWKNHDRDRTAQHRRETLHEYGFRQSAPLSPYSADYKSSPSMMRLNSSQPGSCSFDMSAEKRYPVDQEWLQVPQAPPGFAIAQLLPGHTVRLTVHTPVRLRWRPGQSVLICVPKVTWWQTHPYSIACADPGQSVEGGGSLLVFIVRSRAGFTKSLFQKVTSDRKALEGRLGHDGANALGGVMLRTQVSWAMGSSGRVRWHSFSTVIIVCGGSGVSFGMAVLEAMCRKLGGLLPRSNKDKTTRVRFIWIVREYAHLTWVASTLRRCMEMVEPSQLRVDIHVTGSPRAWQRRLYDEDREASVQTLIPPRAPFARGQIRRGASPDPTCVDGDDGDSIDSQAPTAEIIDSYSSSQEEAANLTDFEGETKQLTMKEKRLSAHLLKEGKIRRSLSQQMKGGETKLPSISTTLSRGNLSRGSSMVGFDSESQNGDTASQSGLLTASPARTRRHTLAEDEDELFIDVSPAEREDLDVVAELARLGKPKLGEAMDEELVTSSSDKVLVAGCGPLTLNNLVRNLVGERLGRHRGLEVYTEEFSY